MGTKIEYAINLLRTSPNSNSFTVHGVDDWNYFVNTGLKVKSGKSNLEKKNHNSMDRMLDKQNVDSIRRTMQMHEDIFNYQVKELHRLYSVQKKLMNEEKKEISKKSRSWDPRINTSTTSEHMNHSHQFIKWHSPNPTSTQFITANSSAAAGSNFHIHAIREDLNSREQSGSCSGDTVRMPRGFDLQRPASASAADQEDMSAGISATDDDQAAGSSSHRIVLKGNKAMKMMSENDTDEESEVELTLSIGSCLSKNKSKSHKPNQLDSSASLKAHDHHHKGGDCSDPTTPISSSSAPLFDQERKQPHWLFHGLKLK